MKPIILTDIDGVVLNWQSNLPYFCGDLNINRDIAIAMIHDETYREASEMFNTSHSIAESLILDYNESDYMKTLSAYTDALCVINQLKSKYDFVAVTAIGKNTLTIKNRLSNLNALFPDAFTDIHTVDYNQSKYVKLRHLESVYGDRIACYVDDLKKHLVSFNNATDKKYTSFLMQRGLNDAEDHEGAIKCYSWYDIKNHLEGIEENGKCLILS